VRSAIRTLQARRYMDLAEHLGSSRKLVEDLWCLPGVAELRGKNSIFSVWRWLRRVYHLTSNVTHPTKENGDENLRLEGSIFNKNMATSQGPQTHGSLFAPSLAIHGLQKSSNAAHYRFWPTIVRRKRSRLLRIHDERSGANRSKAVLGQST